MSFYLFIFIILYIANFFVMKISIIQDPVFLFLLLTWILLSNYNLYYEKLMNSLQDKKFKTITLTVFVILLILLSFPVSIYYFCYTKNFLLKTYSEWVTFIGFFIAFFTFLGGVIINKENNEDINCQNTKKNSGTSAKNNYKYTKFEIVSTSSFSNGKLFKVEENVLKVADWLDNMSGDNLWKIMNPWFQENRDKYKNYPVVNAKSNNCQGNEEWQKQLTDFVNDNKSLIDFPESNTSVLPINFEILEKWIETTKSFMTILEEAWKRAEIQEYKLGRYYINTDGMGYYIKSNQSDKNIQRFWIGLVNNKKFQGIYLWQEGENYFCEFPNRNINNENKEEQINEFVGWITKEVKPKLDSICN